MNLNYYGAFCITQDAPFFFLYKSALTHHWPQASGGIPFGERALLTESPTGASSRGAGIAACPQGT